MGPCRLLKTIFAQFLGKYRVVSALFGKIERLTFTGTFDAFQHLVKSHSFKQICFPHRSEMGVLKSFLKNWLDGDRLRVGAVSVQGKLLVSTIGTALRMMMLCSAKKMEKRKDKPTIPGGSLDRLLMDLTLVRAEKRKNANAWIRNTIPASRRRCFELLQLPEPPRKFIL